MTLTKKRNTIKSKTNKSIKSKTLIKSKLSKIKSSIKNIGILDIKGNNINPLTNKEYQNLYANEKIEITTGNIQPKTYSNLAKIWSTFKVYDYRRQLIKSITENQLTLVKAGTGVGKTVLMPKFALHSVNYNEKVITTIPTRLSTKKAAQFAAQTLDVKLGEEVGYYYQGDTMKNDNTKLIYTTPGSLISKLTGSDPLLEEYKVVIIDEAHERSIQIDILLMLLKQVLMKRSDIRIVIMSATIDLKFFDNYFKNKSSVYSNSNEKIIDSITTNMIDVGTATLHPIQDIYINKPTYYWEEATIKVLMHILTTTTQGDILVFARSSSDGKKICSMLANNINDYNKKQMKNEEKRKDSIKVVQLGGGHTTFSLTGGNNSERKVEKLIATETTKDITNMLNPFCTHLASGISKKDEELALSETEYLRVFNGQYYRKIVVSTNVAESSVTVNGIKFVVDTGLEFTDAYYPEYKSGSLLEERISKASVKQRRGRAGRVSSGTCYHLYTKDEYNAMEDYTKPDIAKTDLTDQIINIMRLPSINTIGEMQTLLQQLITPPEPKFISDALQNLYMLGCITSMTSVGTLTGIGQEITKFRSIPTTMARMIIASNKYNCRHEIIKIAAMLQIANGQIENVFLEFKPNRNLTTSQNKEEHRKYLSIKDKYKNSLSDILALLKIYNDWDKSGQQRKWCERNYISHSLMKRTRMYIKQLSYIRINMHNVANKFIGENRKLTSRATPPNFKFFNNSLVFENKLQLKSGSINERILMSYYIGYIPYICFKKKGKTYNSCNSTENINIQLNTRSFVNKNTVTDFIIPTEIFWSNIEMPLRINIFSNIMNTLATNINYIMKELHINCNTHKKELQINAKNSFKPNYKRL